MRVTKRNVENLRTTQRAMERVMLGTTLKDHIRKDDMLLMVDSHQVTGQAVTMLWIILLITLTVLIWFRFLKPMDHFTRIGVKQTKPWPIIGDLWRTIFRQMSVLESIQFYYNMFPGSRLSFYDAPMNHFTKLGVKQSKPWPIVGDQWTHIFQKMSLLETIEFYYNMFPDTRYSGIYQFNIPTLIIKDPELLKQLTVRDFDHFTDHRTLVDADLDPLWAGNLFALTGQGIDFANLTDADLAAQAMVFYLAGFDTISNAMCFGSYELAVNKEIQNKLRSEIVETHRLNGGKVTYDSVLKMKYMDKVISAVLMWFLFLKPMNHFTRMGVKQSTPWPIVGDLWTNIFWQMSLLETIEFSYNMFPGVRYSGFYQFSIPTLIIKDPELLKQLTIRDFDHFTDHRTLIDADVDPLWAGHLFALTGRKWKDMRATLSGSFSSSKIKNLFNLMNGAAENFVTFFLNKNEKLIVLEMRDTFSRFANDIIATTAFGIEVDSLKSPNNPFHLLGKRITDYSSLVKRLRFFAILIMPKLTKLLKIGLFEKELSSFFYKTVKETIHAREEQGIVRQDMLNVLLEARKGIQHEYSDAIETGFATVKEYTHSGKGPQFANLTDADLAAQAMIFYLAGFDTISNAMSFGSYELAINKKIQNKLRSEIVETHKLNDGKITYDSLLKIQYMDKVISEILRKWPPVGISDRVATKPYTIEPVNANEKPLNLKIGDVVWIPIFGFHRDPKHFENPTKFDPERFSDENKSRTTCLSVLVLETVLDQDLRF
ncbi:hypothetical protein HUJ04_008163 [Dendroctonus ponderosae]|nr:hypothetical protein HUJ04_008163 [Dendroctonus ponderosae]